MQWFPSFSFSYTIKPNYCSYSLSVQSTFGLQVNITLDTYWHLVFISRPEVHLIERNVLGCYLRDISILMRPTNCYEPLHGNGKGHVGGGAEGHR